MIITALINGIDRFTEILGKAVSWLTIALVLVVFVIVVSRYLLGIGSIALQESVTYLHALVFLMGSAFTLKRGGHVRVDIFYRQFSERKKAWVDLLGSLLFLLPLSLLIISLCWDYVIASWAIGETSEEDSGLPWVYLLKSLLLLMPLTMILQGIAEILRNLMFLMGKSDAHSQEQLEKVL